METKAQVFALAPYGELVTSKQGRGVASALKRLEKLAPEAELVIDAGGVCVRPLPWHHILRAARHLLQPNYPNGHLRVVGLAEEASTSLRRALGERRDFHAVETNGAFVLKVTVPAGAVAADGTYVPIGHRRRTMLVVIERDGPGCAWCSKVLSYDHPEATLDHVRPWANDGANGVDNLLLSCYSCNHSRRKRSAGTWLRLCLARGQAVNEEVVRAAMRRVKNPKTKRSVLAARQAQAEARARQLA